MIVIDKVTKFYGKKRSLHNVSLTVNKGEIMGVIGPNGAGKSTLLAMLATLANPKSGKININGHELPKHKKQVREIIGYVPQDVALLEHLSVKENMVFWSGLTSRKTSTKQLMELCEKVQLQDKWTEKVATLSGGMKRKLNIAVALIHDSEIILMDEPTVGIDLQSKFEINQFIKELAGHGKTIVYATHDLNEILYLCTRISVLNNGALDFAGTVTEARHRMELSGDYTKSDEEIIYKLLSGKYVETQNGEE